MGRLEKVRHELFCQFYVQGHPPKNGSSSTWREKPRRNATRAYEAAGYKSTGPVATTAAVRLLRRPEIQARIKELEKLRREAHDGSAA